MGYGGSVGLSIGAILTQSEIGLSTTKHLRVTSDCRGQTILIIRDNRDYPGWQRSTFSRYKPYWLFVRFTVEGVVVMCCPYYFYFCRCPRCLVTEASTININVEVRTLNGQATEAQQMSAANNASDETKSTDSPEYWSCYVATLKSILDEA